MRHYTEIEAKLTIPDRPTMERLLQATEIAGLRKGDRIVIDLQDHYLDTPGRDLLRANLACRVRVKENDVKIGLKTFGKPGGVVKTRQETQQPIDPSTQLANLLDNQQWPAGELRTRVNKITQGKLLEIQFSLQQRRHICPLLDQKVPVATLFVDEVRYEPSEPIFKAELELLPAGNRNQLDQIVSIMAANWQLTADPLSKFEWGLGLRDNPHRHNSGWLSAGELDMLAAIATQTHFHQAPIAHLLLLWAGGMNTQNIATITGRSKRRVQYWLHAFETHRLTLFPAARAKRPPGPKHAEFRSEDPMSEAGRKILRLHFERMLMHEPGTRLGADIEELHDMRVATRRMRAALRLFGPYYQAKAIRPHLKGLKLTGRALGPVRDLDVFEEKAQRYLRDLPAGQAHSLDPLFARWAQERELGRDKMLAHLDSKAYRRFVKRFGEFLHTEGAGIRPTESGRQPHEVQHIVPQLLYARYETVNAYEAVLDSAPISTLHALRIDFKHLRYALEFFVPVLGKEVGPLIHQVKIMQDHLGDLNDADVAVQLLSELKAQDTPAKEGLLAYLQNRQLERERLLQSFPAAWQQFQQPEVCQYLSLAVAAL